MIVAGYVYFQQERDQRMSELRRIVRRQATEISLSLELPMWNFDDDQVHRTLEGSMGAPSLVYLEVEQIDETMPSGIRIQRFYKRPGTEAIVPVEETFSSPDWIRATEPIVSHGQELGKITLYASPQVTLSRLDETMNRMIVLVVVVEAALVGILYLALYVGVIRPLRQVTSYAERVSVGESSAPGQESEGRFIGELEELRVSIERMVSRLEERYNELERSKERFQVLISAAPDAILAFDAHTYVIREANENASVLFGYPQEELVGKSFLEFCDDSVGATQDVEATLQAHVREAMAGQQVVAEHWVRSRDGASHLCEKRLVKLPSEDGDLVRASFVDITRRKEAEDEIRRLNAELEERVRQRTNELSTAVSELEAFSYSVSHDLRSPLRALQGFSSILAHDYAHLMDDEGRVFLERISANAIRMAEIIDNLLGLSRLSRSEIQKSKVDLSAIVLRIAEELRAADSERIVEFQIQCGVFAVADQGLMETLLDNLIGNAWKYTSNRDGAVIEFGETMVDGRTAFFVRDNGAGFDMQYANKLFLPFQRLHASEFPGTGIGLATVQRIVRRHDGVITAHGELGVGATFTVCLDSAVTNQEATIAQRV